MCRNIKILFNFDPPVTPEEIRAASFSSWGKLPGLTNRPKRTRLRS